MSQLFKDWVEVISKITVAIGVIIAALNYRNQTKTKRAEWLRTLFEKFYENENYKEIRRWIESGEICTKINLTDNALSEADEKFTDYLNFFEFIATLESEGQLKEKDVLNLFDYYLRKLKTSDVCFNWIERKDYGFEKLSILLKKLK
ncbi:MAG: hypothetical protein ABJB05_15240 [Parafilimonas sp.]